MKYDVDLKVANDLVSSLKGIVPGIGGFASVVPFPVGYREPMLVMSTDGVGTKVLVAREETVGTDLVAMSVNDLITVGAKPLAFMDYLATDVIDVDLVKTIVDGIRVGCQMANCELVGGETAEMRGLYMPRDYDLAGFAVGVVERDEMLGPHKVQDGDILIGIVSNGPHSNGYTLIRKVLDKATDHQRGMLLNPTRIYVKTMLKLFDKVDIHACAHITGGGIVDNVPRMLPDGLGAMIDVDSWHKHDIWCWLQNATGLSDYDMFHTFNCGIGMVIALPAEDVKEAQRILDDAFEGHRIIGSVQKQRDKLMLIGID